MANNSLTRRFGIYLWRIFAFMAAFTVSVMVAALFMLFLGYLGVADEPELQNIYAYGAAIAFPVIALYVAQYSFPVAVIGMAIGEFWAVRDSLYYMAAGGVIALYGITKLSARIEHISSTTMIAMIATGLLAGLTFWFLTGRRAGNWLEAKTPKAQKSEEL